MPVLLQFDRVLWRSAPCGLLAVCLIVLALLTGGAANAESPDATPLIDRALAWLEKQDDARLGGKCLLGLCFHKAGERLTHPKIAAARAACESEIKNPSGVDNYSVGLALIFLLETDPVKNRALAEQYVVEVLKRQQSAGGWGYAQNPKGDTSQTQYPTLGLWLAANNGIEVPASAFEKTCNWLLRTQDPSGAWGYQGEDPGNYQRVNQMDVRPGLAAAGLGTLYICADLLGVTTIKPPEPDKSLPPALHPVSEEKEKQPQGRALKGAFDPQLVRRAMADGNQWFVRNYTLESEGYTHYYLYALERYHSFRELSERRVDPDPKWYGDVVRMLRKTQEADGHWEGSDTSVIATSFSVLVLVRSARQTIKHVARDLGNGVLLGGMGLPPNTADLRERDGKIIETPLAGNLDELLALIEKPDQADLDRLLESTQVVSLDSDVTKRSGQISRLRRLVSAGAFESRLVAVRALSRVRDLDNVPILIYALSDPDLRIVREADKGLRFFSRKFDGVGLPAEPKPEEVKAAIAAWKAWYQSIRPSAEFLD